VREPTAASKVSDLALTTGHEDSPLCLGRRSRYTKKTIPGENRGEWVCDVALLGRPYWYATSIAANVRPGASRDATTISQVNRESKLKTSATSEYVGFRICSRQDQSACEHSLKFRATLSITRLIRSESRPNPIQFQRIRREPDHVVMRAALVRSASNLERYRTASHGR
jgi:hypothetical protein